MTKPVRSKKDRYRDAIAALWDLAPQQKELTVIARAAHVADRLAQWDLDAHGGWRDVLAIEARRNGVHARDDYVLLAKVLFACSAQRANEIGKLLSHMGDRPGERYAKTVARNGGLKKVVADGVKPPLRPKFGRRKLPKEGTTAR